MSFSAAPGDRSRLRADFLALSCFRATAVLVREVEGQGGQVHGWTVNRAPAMVEVIHDAADGIIIERSGQAASLPTSRPFPQLLRFSELAIDREEPVPDSASLAPVERGPFREGCFFRAAIEQGSARTIPPE